MNNISLNPYRRTSWVLLLLLLTGIQSLNAATEPPRIALVIGNGAYSNIGQLANPPNDARLMAETLRKLGFDVIEKVNVTQKPMKKAIKAFGNRLSEAGKNAVGMFFYAGHGVQVDGQNYLIPVNVDINDEADVDIEAVGVRAILQNMAYAGNGMNIIVMDACRNNPFKRGFRSTSRGLAKMDAAKGTMIAYATAPGDVASDGTGKNSPYTAALTANMLKPGVTIERMFKKVRNAVVKQTNSAQVPWESSSLTGGDFYFSGNTKAESPPVQTTSISTDASGEHERLFWNNVVADPSIEMYEAYLQQFPNGFYALIARIKLTKLKTTPVTSANRVIVDESVAGKADDPIATTADQPIAAIANEPAATESVGKVVGSVSGKYIDNYDYEIILKQVGSKISGYVEGFDRGNAITGTRIGDTITIKLHPEFTTKGTGELKILDDGAKLEGSVKRGGYPASGGAWKLLKLGQ